MNQKKLILGLLPIVLGGCYIDSVSNRETTLKIPAELFFHWSEEENGELPSEIMWESSNYVFPDDVKIEEQNIVAGDQLVITMQGMFENICTLTGPGNCTLKGKVKNYYLKRTEVRGMDIDLAEDGNLFNFLRENYALRSEYIVLDKTGKSTRIDQYSGSTVYLSEDLDRKERECTCPENALCQPCPDFKYIAGVYAFDPTKVE